MSKKARHGDGGIPSISAPSSPGPRAVPSHIGASQSASAPSPGGAAHVKTFSTHGMGSHSLAHPDHEMHGFHGLRHGDGGIPSISAPSSPGPSAVPSHIGASQSARAPSPGGAAKVKTFTP